MAIAWTFEPSRDSELSPNVDTERERDVKGEWLVCMICDHRITALGNRMSLDGGHEHTFTNPHHIVFRIGLFAEAIGCAAQVQPTEEHSWFPGYRWRIGVCRHCHTHLGWRFEAVPGASRDPASFYGLITSRLRAEDS